MNKKQLKEIELELPDVSSDDDIEQENHNLNNYNVLNRIVSDSRRITFHNGPSASYQTNFNFSRGNTKVTLKSVDLIPAQFRNVFASFPYFNQVQSIVFDDIVYSDKNIVISAPTSSGKTVLLELAIVRLLISLNYQKNLSTKFKIVYIAPLKALCAEKYTEWKAKFEDQHGLKCIELTGDSNTEDQTDKEIEMAHLICTTPEKWDTMTRKWKNRLSIMNTVRLMLIDEVHILGENSRGALIEAVISRMKLFSYNENAHMMRFIAISATIPNIDDIASWLCSDYSTPATIHKLNEAYRPVKLKKIVLGYYCGPATSFCSSRKGTSQAANILAKNFSYVFSVQQRQTLSQVGFKLADPQLKDLIVNKGIGFHHAGLDQNDRLLIESLFLNGHLFVLFSTSTLAIGVNFPAHLVIIKSTMCYSNQSFVEYSATQILQMIGRAGRPQFDTSATAVIMTKDKEKQKYELLVEGEQHIESQLHKSLIEHLNVEIVLRTVINMSTAISWLKSTFLYVRIKKNPQYYGLGLNKSNLKLTNENRIEQCLRDLCIKSIMDLMDVNLVEKCDFIQDPDAMLKPTLSGQLMARYCIAFQTMKLIITNISNPDALDNSETSIHMEDLIKLVSNSKEFDDIKLRVNEKSILNAINNNGKMPKTSPSNLVRFIQEGKIKTTAMKINCLIQAQLGSIGVQDFSLQQDIFRIFQVGRRITRCIYEYQFQINSQSVTGTSHLEKNFLTFINSVMLYKNFVTKLWHDSDHLFRQFNRIGATLSQSLVNAGITSIEHISRLSPQRLERILNKNPPFGNIILETIEKLPRFKIEFDLIQSENCEDMQLDVTCCMQNFEYIQSLDDGGCLGFDNQIVFIAGDVNNNLLFTCRLNNNAFLCNHGRIIKRLPLNKISLVHCSLVLLQFVGLDVHETFDLNDSNAADSKFTSKPTKKKLINFQNEIYIENEQEHGSLVDYENEINSRSSPLKRAINSKPIEPTVNHIELAFQKSIKQKEPVEENVLVNFKSSPLSRSVYSYSSEEATKNMNKENRPADHSNSLSRAIFSNNVQEAVKKNKIQMLTYSPPQAQAEPIISKVSEKPIERKFQFNKKIGSRIEINRVNRSNLKELQVQSNKIDSYFRPDKTPFEKNADKKLESDHLAELFKDEDFDSSIADLEMGIRNSPPQFKPYANTDSKIEFKQSVYFNDLKRKHQTDKIDEPPIQLLKKFEKSAQKKFKLNSTASLADNNNNKENINNSAANSTKLEFLSSSLNISSDTREFMRRTYFGSKLDQLNDLYDD